MLVAIMSANKSVLKRTILRILFCGILATVTHQSLAPVPASVFSHWSDKLIHIVAWLTVAIAFGLAFSRLKSVQSTFIPLFGYSVLVEMGQIFVPGRSFSGLDILANATGCALGLLIVAVGVPKFCK